MGIMKILLLMSFSLVQLFEFLLWTFLHNPDWNRILSFMLLLLVIMQPLMAILSMPETHTYKNILLLGYGAFVFLIILWSIMNPIRLKTSISPNGHLFWEWLQFPIPFIAMWIILFLTPIYFNSQLKYHIGLIFSILTVGFSLYYYYREGTWASIWCWISNLIWLFVIIDILFWKVLKNKLCKKEKWLYSSTFHFILSNDTCTSSVAWT